MNRTDQLVRRRVDVTTNDTTAFFLGGQPLQLLLVTTSETDRLLDSRLDGFAQREIFLTAHAPPPVVNAVKTQQLIVSHRPQSRNPRVLRRHLVKSIAVHDQIIALRSLVNVLVDNRKPSQAQRKKTMQHIIMVAAQIHDFGIFFLQLAQDQPDKPRVRRAPVMTPARQVPSIYDVAVQDQLFTATPSQQVIDFMDFAIRSA